MRIVPVARIPDALWKGALLRLPSALRTAYQQRLKDLGQVEEAAKGTSKKDIYGGLTFEETVEHFTHRFAVSAARAECVLLDPQGKLAGMPDALISTLSQGHIAVLDIPCGAATSTSALLSTIADLREHGVLPRLPITVSITGGDRSDTALDLGAKMLKPLGACIATQGVTLRYQFRKWDAVDPEDTAKLIDTWLDHAHNAEEYVVCISNFSGALIKSKLYEKFQPCLEQILARLHSKKITLLWVEPDTSDAQRKLWPLVWAFLTKRLPAFVLGRSKDEAPLIKYRFEHPINGSEIQTGLTVQRFIRL